jgi:hypothetical protein
MRSSLSGLGAVALVALGLAVSPASAQYYNPPTGYYGHNPYSCAERFAPDMCSGYFYCTDGCNWYPSYCVYPPFPPFNGIRPGMPTDCPKGPAPTPYQFYQQQALCGPGNGGAMPVNPWTRSPRDYFMWTEAQQEILTRQRRPAFVP